MSVRSVVISEIFEDLADLCEDAASVFGGSDGLPTRGLELAARQWRRAARMVREPHDPSSSELLARAIDACWRGASVGLEGMATALSEEPMRIKPFCGAHCQTCPEMAATEHLGTLAFALSQTSAAEAVDRLASKLMTYSVDPAELRAVGAQWLEFAQHVRDCADAGLGQAVVEYVSVV
jgi:hypothetical protein